MSTPQPFFTTAEVGTPRHRALLISAAFPPLHYVGSLRWRSFVKVGADRGWSFDVVMEDPSRDQVVDMDLLKDAPAALRLFAFDPPQASEMKLAHSAWTRLTRLFRSNGRAGEVASPTNTSSKSA